LKYLSDYISSICWHTREQVVGEGVELQTLSDNNVVLSFNI